jgi:hypothetical protein
MGNQLPFLELFNYYIKFSLHCPAPFFPCYFADDGVKWGKQEALTHENETVLAELAVYVYSLRSAGVYSGAHGLF